MEAGRAPCWGSLIRSLMILPWPRFLKAGRAMERRGGGFFVLLSISLVRETCSEPLPAPEWSELHSSAFEAPSTHSSCPSSWPQAPRLLHWPCLRMSASQPLCPAWDPSLPEHPVRHSSCATSSAGPPPHPLGVSLLLPSVPIALCILPGKPSSSLSSDGNCTLGWAPVLPQVELETRTVSSKAL